MKNKNKTIWANRFKGKTSKSFQRIGSSINIDKRLYKQDIIASIVHVQMLVKQKIIHRTHGKKIVNGLMDKHKTNFKGVGQPLRVVLTGSKFGPGIYNIILSLDKNEAIKRLQMIK